MESDEDFDMGGEEDTDEAEGYEKVAMILDEVEDLVDDMLLKETLPSRKRGKKSNKRNAAWSGQMHAKRREKEKELLW